MLRTHTLAYEQRLAAAQAVEEKFAKADALRAEAAAMLTKAHDRGLELDQREKALSPAERKLADRAKQLDDREAEQQRRERLADARHAHLSELAREAAV